MSAYTAFEAIFTICEIVLCIWLFCRSYIQREQFSLRAAASLSVFAAIYCAGALGGNLSQVSPSVFFVSQFIAFVWLLALCVGLVMLCYRTSIWNALFCCTAGYTVQNIASGLHGFTMIVLGYLGVETMPSTSGAVAVNPLITAASLLVTSATVIGLSFFLYVRHIRLNGLEDVESRRMFVAAIAVVLFEIAFDLVNKSLSQPLAPGVPNDFPALFLVILKLTHLATCLIVLFMQYEMLYNKRLQIDHAALERMAQDQQRHYELSRESIEAINLRCHDIRHRIQDLGSSREITQEALEGLAREVDVYDSAVKTGNEALDVILTEKSLLCGRDGITLSCIADGTCVQFISSADLYSLFGNALDNAMEAVREIGGRERRNIGLVVRRSGEMASIHVENYFCGQMSFKNGLPQTTKRDGRTHGYGMKSIRQVAERYGGTLSCRTQGDIFYLDALIPIPDEAVGTAR